MKSAKNSLGILAIICLSIAIFFVYSRCNEEPSSQEASTTKESQILEYDFQSTAEEDYSEFDLSQSDQTARPKTRISRRVRPALISTATTAKFKFQCNTPPCTFKCKLDNLNWQDCSSPKFYKWVDEGDHTFRVKAIDASGNRDWTPAIYTWSVCIDNDGDGFYDNPDNPSNPGLPTCPGLEDCDDTKASIKAGVPEVCDDLKDNNCDGLVDQMGIDNDGDGADACNDCDDNPADDAPDCASKYTCADQKYPGATERCPHIDGGGVDQNCDNILRCNGTVDADSDEYGSTGSGGTDCKDTDPAFSPNAQEVCPTCASSTGKNVDENCDGSYLCDCPAGDCTGKTDGDGDNYLATASGGSDCQDGDSTVYPNACEKCDGKDNQCTGNTGYGNVDFVTSSGDLDNSCGGDVTCSYSSCTGNCTKTGVGNATDNYCDEGVGCASNVPPCTDQGCSAGQKCSAGTCVSATEVCNGSDDNCDGKNDYISAPGDLDNSCGIDTSCAWSSCTGNCTKAGGTFTDFYCNEGGGCITNNSAPCSDQDCVAGQKCSVGTCVFSSEICNGTDDNCDGKTDYISVINDLDSSCGTDGCAWSNCSGNCTKTNGILTDFDCVEGVGCSSTTSASCSDETCSGGNKCSAGSCVSASETCNSADDDCDSSIDEGLAIACYNDSNCNDSNTCTIDTCNNPGNCSASCSHPPVSAGTLCGSYGSCTCSSCSGNCSTNSCIQTAPACNASGSCSSTTSQSCSGWTCSSGQKCSGGSCVSASEICNGSDDDCDGSIDEGLPIACYSNPDCNDGNVCTIYTCNNAGTCSSSCSYSPAPSSTQCGSDTSCSATGCSGNCGKTGTYTDYHCNGSGSCQGYSTSCTPSPSTCPGGTRCSGGSCISASETCNGADDDCDGSIDEGLPVACYGSSDCDDGNVCTTNTCNNAGTCSSSCSFPPAPTSTQCGSDTSCTANGCSGNCNKTGTYTDYHCNGSGGCSGYSTSCTPSPSTCSGGTRCSGGSCISASETCNGADDDCDGSIDEGLPVACYGSSGCDDGNVCTTNTCNNAGTCSSSCSFPPAPTSTQCGSDTSCTANGCSNNCTKTGNYTDYHCNGSGGCSGYSTSCTPSPSTCSAGTKCSGGSCVSASETCNGIDDDCDGSIDEGTTDSNACYALGDKTGTGSISAISATIYPSGNVDKYYFYKGDINNFTLDDFRIVGWLTSIPPSCTYVIELYKRSGSSTSNCNSYNCSGYSYVATGVSCGSNCLKIDYTGTTVIDDGGCYVFVIYGSGGSYCGADTYIFDMDFWDD